MTHQHLHLVQGANLETALDHELDPEQRATIIEDFYAFLHKLPLEPVEVAE